MSVRSHKIYRRSFVFLMLTACLAAFGVVVWKARAAGHDASGTSGRRGPIRLADIPIEQTGSSRSSFTGPEVKAQVIKQLVGTSYDAGKTSAAAAASNFVVSVPVTTPAGSVRTFTVTAMNSLGSVEAGYTGTVTFTSSDPAAALPANYTFTGADQGVRTFQMVMNTPGTRTITVVDTANSSVRGTSNNINVTPTTCGITVLPGNAPAGGYLPLSSFGVPPVPNVDDDTVTNFNTPAYTYNGATYTSIGFASNGYAVVGGGNSTDDNSFVGQNFPNPARPNNVLAPFWTDLLPSAGGAMRIATLTDGMDTWIVLDWEAVKEFSNANTDTFQIWIGINGDAHPGEDITFPYGPVSAGGNQNGLTVGAEGAAGNFGYNRYFNFFDSQPGPRGILPGNGTQLRVTSNVPCPVATTVNVASSANPSVAGQGVTYTATVTPILGSTPTGTVTFTEGATTLCNAVPLNGAGQASCTPATPPGVGTHVVIATYNPTGNFTASSALFVQFVNKASLTLTVTGISAEPSVVNQAYTVSWDAVVNSPGSGTPTGTFTVSDGSGGTCSAAPVPNVNSYSCSLISSLAGGKQIRVTYAGDANFNAAQSLAVVHNVVGNPAPGFEGDINGAVLGTGDGDVTVADVTVAGRVLRGEVCPKVNNPNFQQKFDAGPRTSLGDGLRGSSDVDAIDVYSRHDSTTDANPATPVWDPTPAGGPTTMSNLGCTPAPDRAEDMLLGLSRPAPDPDAAMRTVRLVPVDAGNTRQRVVTVDVEMDSDGTEAGTQFSLSWDASRASLSSISGVGRNTDVSLGSEAPEGTRLNVNAENAQEGTIGIVESFTAARSEDTLTSGTRRIVRLTFHVTDGETFSASDIRFTDDVVRRQTVDSIGQDLDVPGGYGEPGSDDKTLSLGHSASIMVDRGE